MDNEQETDEVAVDGVPEGDDIPDETDAPNANTAIELDDEEA